MRWGRSIALILALAAPVSAAPRKSPAHRPSGAKAAAAPQAQTVPKLMQSCDAHKFETVVDVTVDGQPRKSKVKLCGVEGQSDAAWIETLRDAINKLEANKDMPAAQRDQIVAAIKSEIARLDIMNVSAPAPATASVLPPVPQAAENSRDVTSSNPVSRDYAVLPPLPTQPQAPPSPPPAAPVEAAATPSVSPAAVPTPPVVAPVAIPELSFACYAPGDLQSDAPCGEFVRETVLTVRASGAMPAGAALRFVRNGKARADVDLTSLSNDKQMKLVLPREVCEGFGAGRLELQIVANGSIERTEGPYPLRCY